MSMNAAGEGVGVGVIVGAGVLVGVGDNVDDGTGSTITFTKADVDLSPSEELRLSL
jgi:hypothetical protein